MFKSIFFKTNLFERILVIFSFLFVALLVFYRIQDPDFFWHLANGKAMLEQGRIINEEIFSYTRQGVPFSNHEWLSQILFYLIFKAWGPLGIVIFKTAIVLLTSFFIYKTSRSAGAGPLFSSLLQIMVILAGVMRYRERPEIFSFLFFSVLGFILLGFRNKKIKQRYLFFIPVIMVLWDFMHGAVYGILFLSAFIIGETLKVTLKNISTKETDYGYLKALWVLFAVTLLAMAINPYGFRSYDIFLAFFKTNNKMVSDILELMPPTLSNFPLFWALFSITVVLTIIFIRELDITQLFILVPFGILAVRYNRATNFFELASVPALVYYKSLISERIKSETVAGYFKIINYAALLVTFGYILFLKFTPDSPLTFGYNLNSIFFPIGSTRYIERENLTGNMYNPGHFGGYLAYYLYPQRKIYLYNHHLVFADLPRVTQDESILNRYDIQYAVLERFWGDSKDYGRIFTDKEWTPVFWDDASFIMVRNTPENHSFLEKNRLLYFMPQVLDALKGQTNDSTLKMYESDPTILPVLTREIGRCLSCYKNDLLADYLGNLLLAPQNPITRDERLTIAAAALKYNPSSSTLLNVEKTFQRS
jgi:hypothetical protein